MTMLIFSTVDFAQLGCEINEDMVLFAQQIRGRCCHEMGMCVMQIRD